MSTATSNQNQHNKRKRNSYVLDIGQLFFAGRWLRAQQQHDVQRVRAGVSADGFADKHIAKSVWKKKKKRRQKIKKPRRQQHSSNNKTIKAETENTGNIEKNEGYRNHRDDKTPWRQRESSIRPAKIIATTTEGHLIIPCHHMGHDRD